MRKLAEICIHRPVFACMLILALVVVGSTAYMKLGVDRFPSVDLPTVSVNTTLRGASPEEIETEVTQVLEEAVNTIDGIDELRSISGPGQSILSVTFRLDRNVDVATQDVRDRVSKVVKNLPRDTDPPIISKVDNDSRPVMTIALSAQRPMRELRELADNQVSVQLERAKGVGSVNVIGGLQRSINVRVEARKLAAYGIPVTAIRDAVVAQNAEVPGGRITDANTERQLRTMGRIEDPAKFNDIVVARPNGVPVRIRDLGYAEDGTKEQRSVARLNGVPTVILEIRRQSGANTIEVIEAAKAQMARLAGEIPTDVKMEVIEDQSRYIYAALHEIDTHLIMGSIFACLVVLFFMRSLRSVIIAGLAIPASVISTFGMMWALGFTLNSVTMLALVLMVGIVIDDAIVVLENIFRMVEEKHMRPMEAAKRGTAEIALAVLATTMSLVVIFIPVSFMSSISGRFLYQFGMTAAVAVTISLLVSFTLTPMLGARMLKAEKLTDSHHPASRGGFYAIIDRIYTALLKLSLRHRPTVAIIALLIIGSSIPLYQLVKQDYLPSDVDEGEFSVGVTARDGTAFDAMDKVMRSVEADLAKLPEIRVMLATAGGGFLNSTSTGRVYIRMAPHEERLFSFGRLWRCTLNGHPMDAFKNNYSQGDLMAKVRQALRKYRDVRIAVRNQPSFNVGGSNTDIDLNIRGPELEKLAEYTEHLRQMSASGDLPGIIEADTTLKFESAETHIVVNREKAADLGVQLSDMGSAVGLMVGGSEEISRFHDRETDESYDVDIRLVEQDRNSPDLLGTLLLPRKGSQELVELRSIAQVETVRRPYRIDRLNRERCASLRAAVDSSRGYALVDRLELLNKTVAEMNMPSAYSTSISGRGRELQRTFVEFIFAFMLSVAFMYMILASNYESLVDPLTILLSLPLAVPFAFLSLYLSGGTLNLYSALGILVLFGVVKKNAILQVDHTKGLRAQGFERTEAIIQGSRDRLRPILMTTFALVAGMLPLALGSGPGAQERRAVGIVVIGGQMLCLTLTLLVTPVAYSFLDDIGAWILRRHPRPPVEPDSHSPEPEVLSEHR